MQKQSEKFLEFNGRVIQFLAVDGTTWVAVKPICEALGVDYVRQFKNLNEDEILSQLLSEQTMVAADGKLRKMVCLPEKYIYGWLFGIRSESEELKAYKLECYNVLYDHFHGVMTQRLHVLLNQADAEQEVAKWTEELEKTDAFQKLQEAKSKIKQANQLRTKLDHDLKAGQLSVFDKN